MPIQVAGVLLRAMSGTELSRVRTEFRLRLPERINKSPLESRGPTLLCNQMNVRGRERNRFPTFKSLTCEVHAGDTEASSKATTFYSRGRIGWGGWTRTNTVLINSEVSYQLDHAPAVPRL